MNERIQQLAEQATTIVEMVGPQGYTSSYANFDREKFAELIVQECVAQIRPMWNQVKEVGAPPGYDYDTFDLAYNDCMNAIKEHFGVEK
jgi:hypothetical protein